MLQVIDVRRTTGYRVWLAFSDGHSGEIDLEDVLYGPMFEPLMEGELFASLRIDPLLQTVVWANGADLAPEFLLERLLQGTAQSSSASLSA